MKVNKLFSKYRIIGVFDDICIDWSKRLQKIQSKHLYVTLFYTFQTFLYVF